MTTTNDGFKANPFFLTPDPNCCFEHSSLNKALKYLKYALDRAEGFVIVTGQSGIGKTLLAELFFVESKKLDDLTCVKLVSTQLQPKDLLPMIAYLFGLKLDGMSKASIAQEIKQYLSEQCRLNRRVILIVDEAQNLQHDALEELRLLTTYQHNNRPLLQIFFIGQDSLWKQIKAPGMEQFFQRIIISCTLKPLTAAETKGYIEYRLASAGWNGTPDISDEAFQAVHKYSKGIPRYINQVCARLILHASIENKETLEAEDVSLVIRELEDEELSPDLENDFPPLPVSTATASTTETEHESTDTDDPEEIYARPPPAEVRAKVKASPGNAEKSQSTYRKQNWNALYGLAIAASFPIVFFLSTKQISQAINLLHGTSAHFAEVNLQAELSNPDSSPTPADRLESATILASRSPEPMIKDQLQSDPVVIAPSPLDNLPSPSAVSTAALTSIEPPEKTPENTSVTLTDSSQQSLAARLPTPTPDAAITTSPVIDVENTIPPNATADDPSISAAPPFQPPDTATTLIVTTPPETSSNADTNTDELTNLLGKARQAINELRLTTPAKNCAFTYLKKAQSIDSNNPEISAGFDRITARYGVLAENAIAVKDWKNARRYLSRGLTVQSSNKQLLNLQSDLRALIAKEESERLNLTSPVVEQSINEQENPTEAQEKDQPVGFLDGLRSILSEEVTIDRNSDNQNLWVH